MTPLEEIEDAIAFIREVEPQRGAQIGALGPLYQARAIERLEATVRAIGVTFQAYAAETLPLMHRMADIARPAPDPASFGLVSWDAPHRFQPGGLRGECQCMRPRADPLHTLPPFGAVCVECQRPVGEQHRPSCHRQGIVSAESVRR